MLKEIRWTAPEFEYYEKSATWYWLSGIVALVIVAAAFLQRNFLFAIFVVLAEVLVIQFGKKQPKEIEYKLDHRQLEIDGKRVYSYETLMGFSMIDGELILRKKSKMSSLIKVLVHERDYDRMKQFLQQFLPEIEYEESLTDHISRWLKF